VTPIAHDQDSGKASAPSGKAAAAYYAAGICLGGNQGRAKGEGGGGILYEKLGLRGGALGPKAEGGKKKK